jgi:hypothetical protein
LRAFLVSPLAKRLSKLTAPIVWPHRQPIAGLKAMLREHEAPSDKLVLSLLVGQTALRVGCGSDGRLSAIEEKPSAQ